MRPPLRTPENPGPDYRLTFAGPASLPVMLMLIPILYVVGLLVLLALAIIDGEGR